MEKNTVYLSHIADIFLYEYYVAGDKSYEIGFKDVFEKHIKKARQLMIEKEYSEALNEWINALDYNPVCMEAINEIITCYKFLSNIEKAYEYTCKSYEDMGIDEIQKILEDKKVPLKANSVTLALLYKAGLEALDRGNKEQAYDCFSMVYDLTQDAEVKEMIGKLSS
ncbi:MAG: hypothetical protein K6D02_08065 [Lachnospiraceae bacterium]|nr:hypothetical protein [Lachnospiraceae bacterium]